MELPPMVDGSTESRRLTVPHLTEIPQVAGVNFPRPQKLLAIGGSVV